MLLLAFVSTVWSATPKEKLKDVKQEINARKKLISKTRKEEAVVSKELEEINRNLERKKSDLGKMDRDLLTVESGLDRTGKEINRVTDEAGLKKLEIERRLTSLYKAGELGALRMFFSSESFPRMAENIRYMRSILDNDKKIFAEYSNKIEELGKLQIKLEQDVTRKERIKQGIAVKKQEIEKEQKKKNAYLLKVRHDRKRFEASLKELQANASRLQSMINALNRRKTSSRHEKRGNKFKAPPELPPVPDRGFASQKGRMSLPVRGKIEEDYGMHKHPEFNSYTFSKGLSISAGLGADIHSIYDGSVIYAGYFKGYGNMIIVDHGGGYFSLYAHASKILKKVGDDVARNEVVATVGDMDSARGPMLYFEIRNQGKSVDPAGWVR